jgi:hypothetical protein
MKSVLVEFAGGYKTEPASRLIAYGHGGYELAS